MDDLIKRADAMGAVQDHFNANGFKGYDDGQKMMDRIKALPSAELPKGELISRADAIEALDKEYRCTDKSDDWDGLETAIKIIDTLPSADAETKCVARIEVDTEEIVRRIKEEYDITDGWIPCSEMLPSESGDYLCTIPLDAEENYTEVLMFHKGRFYEDDAEWGATCYDDVLAWQPLPTPYKGGDDE